MQETQRGFTLIEILVVMTILVFIVGFGLFVSLDSYRGFAFKSERYTLLSVLQKARSESMSNTCIGTSCTDALPHGVHYDSGTHCGNSQPCYIIFQGSTINFSNTTNQAIPVNNKVTITDLLNNPPADVVFNQLDGSVAAAWAVKIADNAGHSAQITINTEGQIDTP